MIDMKCAPDIANILTNFTTIDLSRSLLKNPKEVYDFLDSKNVNCFNHLISGDPTSQILSYLVNHRMFDEMQTLSEKNNVKMSIYVDDITFSCERRINSAFKNNVFAIIAKYGYHVSKHKVKSYGKRSPKLVTGVVIDAQGNLQIKNSLRKKIVTEYEHLRNCPEDTKARERIIGLINSARQVEKGVFPSIYCFASVVSKPKSDTNKQGILKK